MTGSSVPAWASCICVVPKFVACSDVVVSLCNCEQKLDKKKVDSAPSTADLESLIEHTGKLMLSCMTNTFEQRH